MPQSAVSCVSSGDASYSGASPNISSPLSSPAFSNDGDVNHLNIAGGTGADPTFVLVIGGLGYIGSHTVLELLRAGLNVIIVDSLSNSYEGVLHNIRTLIAQDCKSKGANVPLLHFHRVDYRSRSMRFLLESYTDLVPVKQGEEKEHGHTRNGMRYESRITGVIHFAAYKSVSESIQQPLAYYQNNVCGLVSLLQLLDKFNINKFIFSSSATVYGAKANSGIALCEDDLIHHVEKKATTLPNGSEEVVIREPTVSGLTCPYGRTKYMAEAILADVAVAEPGKWDIVALRYFNPVGCDPSGLLGESPRNVPTNLYPVLTQVLTGGRPNLNVFGSDWATRDGTAIRDFVHVLDVARGHVAALKPTAAPATDGFRTYNLGSGTGTTVLEAVRSLESASGRSIPLNMEGRRAGDVGVCVASNTRARQELGWSPRETVERCAIDLWNFVSKVSGMKETVTPDPTDTKVSLVPEQTIPMVTA